jgi:hypothetical protein
MAGTAGISVLRSLQFEVRRMLDAHVRIEEGQSSPNMKLRPPVWQSEWPAYRARLSKWPVAVSPAFWSGSMMPKHRPSAQAAARTQLSVY